MTRSQMMARIRSKDTRPEVATRAAVYALGERYRKHVSNLPGKPDLANKSRRWAIFVHGCLWHSHHNCRLASVPKSNSDYWTQKLSRNNARDEEKISSLRAHGYRVLVVWECEVREGRHLGASLEALFTADRSGLGSDSSSKSTGPGRQVLSQRRLGPRKHLDG